MIEPKGRERAVYNDCRLFSKEFIWVAENLYGHCRNNRKGAQTASVFACNWKKMAV